MCIYVCVCVCLCVPLMYSCTHSICRVGVNVGVYPASKCASSVKYCWQRAAERSRGLLAGPRSSTERKENQYPRGNKKYQSRSKMATGSQHCFIMFHHAWTTRWHIRVWYCFQSAGQKWVLHQLTVCGLMSDGVTHIQHFDSSLHTHTHAGIGNVFYPSTITGLLLPRELTVAMLCLLPSIQSAAPKPEALWIWSCIVSLSHKR